MSKASDLADQLIGTATNIIPEEELETSEALEEFDSLAFNCAQCGWWCSTDELHNESSEDLCDDCHRENNDDDDD